MKTNRATSAIAMVSSLALLLVAGSAYAGGGERGRCKGFSLTQDASTQARFEAKKGRDKFSASVEIAATGTAMGGDVLAVVVDGITVGDVTLVAKANGDLGGDLSFDTTAGVGDAASPFPANFPAGVGVGSSVSVGDIGCVLN